MRVSPGATHLRRGDRVELELTDLSYRGDAVGHAEGRFAVFVAGGLPGERAIVEIEESRSNYARGTVRELIVPAADRVAPPCPYFGNCGGCQLQHLAYASQLRWKSKLVRRQLVRVGHLESPLVHPTIGMVTPWNYRNQARFSVDDAGRLCFTRPQSHRLLPIDDCRIMQPEIVALMPRLQGVLPGAHHVVVRYGARTGQFLITPKLPLPESELPSDQPSYEEILLGRTYRVSAPSFFQVNTRPDHPVTPAGLSTSDGGTLTTSDNRDALSQADVLAQLVLDRLPLTGSELVVDAYGGVGTFALLIAERARRVIGIEEARSAILDAEHNARGLDNVEFIVGKAEDHLARLPERPAAVVLDPSRLGCDPAVLAELAELRPETVVYVSCDPATLARDLSRLVARGYELIDVQPIDMFPQTHHIECVSVLTHPG